MDETDVQTMLQRLADTAAPPARIDVGRAVSEGRRGKRRRQTRIGGLVLAAGAAAGVVVALLAVPGPRAAGVPPAASTTARPAHTLAPMPASAPVRFDPLVPYVSFGWLPSGYAVSGDGPQLTTTTRDVELSVAKGTGPNWADLDVYSRGSCKRSGPASLPVLNCSNGDGTPGPLKAVSVAPDVNGRPAFWGADYVEGGSLFWEYAPGAWATLYAPSRAQGAPASSERPLLSRVAANVRYGQGVPLRFPYWLTGIPADWAVSSVIFTEPSPGVLLAGALAMGPAADLGALGLDIQPTTPGGACKFIAGQSSYVTLDGVRAVFRVDGEWESVCAADARGYLVDNGLDTDVPNTSTPVPGEAGLGGVVGISRGIHLVDVGNPATWTTDPIR